MSDDTTPGNKPTDPFTFTAPPNGVIINAVSEPGHVERCKAQFRAWQEAQKRKRREERRRRR